MTFFIFENKYFDLWQKYCFKTALELENVEKNFNVYLLPKRLERFIGDLGRWRGRNIKMSLKIIEYWLLMRGLKKGVAIWLMLSFSMENLLIHLFTN